jgi:hypothetical protein
MVLSIVVAGSATATSWTGDRALTKSGGGYGYRGGLAVSSGTLVHAVYEQFTLGQFMVWYRRSTDSGTTWGTPILLSRPGVGDAGVPAVDAAGSAVDAVWIEGDDIINGLDSTVVYRRSADGGLTWQDPIQISATTGRAGFPRVLHGPAGHVIVTWTDQVSGRVFERLSVDGGKTFGATVLIATTSNRPFPSRTVNEPLYEAYPSAAAGTGVIYLVYFSTARTLLVRRSFDGGVHWGTAVALATSADGQDAAAVAAYGSGAIVGYAAVAGADRYSVVKRTTDGGGHWGSPVALSPLSGYPSFAPVLVHHGTSWLAAYERCTSNSCSGSDVWLRISGTGSTWTAATKASVRKRSFDAPEDVEVATKILVLYDDVNSSSGDVYVRQGS